jgi:PAS domain S-box-containing protein
LKAAGWMAVAILLFAVVANRVSAYRWRKINDRVYRIGWEVDPPFQVRGDDGLPTGLAIELVRDAAHRHGIRLEWILQPGSSEGALRNRKVDLWPLLTITPERKRVLHISDPYMQHENCFLVRAGSRYLQAQDLAGAAISCNSLPINEHLIRAICPSAQVRAKPSLRDAIEDVCEQRTDAAFMDEFTGLAVLFGGMPCPGRPLRLVSHPTMRTTLGVGSTPEAAAVADRIREGIGAASQDGELTRILTRWGYLSPRNIDSMTSLLNAKQRERRLIGVIGLIGSLLGLTVFGTDRIRRQRNRIKATERAYRESEQKLRLMANNLSEVVLAYDMDRRLVFANLAVEKLTGYSIAGLQGSDYINLVHPDDKPRVLACWDSLFEGANCQGMEFRLVSKKGDVKWVSATWGTVLNEADRQIGVQGCVHDITKRKLAEEALRESQERYLQAQKLESIGRLAGGVAHDFNNLLTVINGYSDLAFQKLGEGEPLRLEIDQIRKAGARAADLTQQLLAFSRKQVIQPRPLDLNKVVAESEKMLRRLLGEDIELKTCLSPSLGQVMADSGQIHQILMNLVVNARDAMPDGGELILETSNLEIDSSYIQEHPEATPGMFVLLAVTDSGMGMDEETSKHIFEPFFTTKGPSRGSGLGLATVYGIVKQSQGWIALSTRPGKGTAFEIYLPRITAELATDSDTEEDRANLEGSETVLVVEDQDEVRELATKVLKDYGYRVLEAADGAKALALVQVYPGLIDLLLTDVVLPGMNGRELAECLRELLPAVKVLYTSGYSQNLIAHRGVLYHDVAYIAKPYTPDGLATKVREVLLS